MKTVQYNTVFVVISSAYQCVVTMIGRRLVGVTFWRQRKIWTVVAGFQLVVFPQQPDVFGASVCGKSPPAGIREYDACRTWVRANFLCGDGSEMLLYTCVVACVRGHDGILTGTGLNLR